MTEDTAVTAALREQIIAVRDQMKVLEKRIYNDELRHEKEIEDLKKEVQRRFENNEERLSKYDEIVGRTRGIIIAVIAVGGFVGWILSAWDKLAAMVKP
jgi:hypothetical protein